MRNRLDLHQILINILGSNNVYFQAPSKLDFPCILYEKINYRNLQADNIKYNTLCEYKITYIRKTPDREDIVQQILNLPYCSFDRSYISENLYHDVFNIYF